MPGARMRILATAGPQAQGRDMAAVLAIGKPDLAVIQAAGRG